MEDIIKQILDKDEIVLLNLKPNKKRYFIDVVGSSIVVFLFLAAFAALTVFSDWAEGEDVISGLLPFIIVAGIILLGMLISLIVRIIGYHKIFYVVTDKRIIIKSGIIGADFRTLEFKMITGINVNVGLFDKLMKPNTGTIFLAAPMAYAPTSNGSKAPAGFAMTCVDNPYKVFKKVKEIVDEHNAK